VPTPVRVQAETCYARAGAQSDPGRRGADGVRGGTQSRVQSADVRPGVRLGIDVGSVRIGVARSDPSGLLASPLGTVRRGAGDLTELTRLADQNDAVEIVVGLAVGLRGAEGRAAAEGREFAERLARQLAPLPVRLVDERFTTVLAHSALQRSGQDARARRQAVDKAAAAVLLQGALDAERSTGEPAGELVVAGGSAR
jgi:putative holliday junction resolvase